MEVKEITKLRLNTGLKIKKMAKEHKDGSGLLEKYWNLVKQEADAGKPFSPKAPWFFKEYWINPKSRDGKPGGEDDVFNTTHITPTSIPTAPEKHRYKLYITIINSIPAAVDKVEKYFENLGIEMVDKDEFEGNTTLIYGFEGVDDQFDMLKRATTATMDLLVDTTFQITVSGKKIKGEA